MNRRELITSFGALATLPLAVSAQHQSMRRIGVLFSGAASDPATRPVLQGLIDGLREHGWEEGRHVKLEVRFAGPDPARFGELAAELVALNVDAIATANTQALWAAQRATTRIPIIMAGPTDPVGAGFVASLARPGGNITGLASQMETVVGKHFELLKEVKPDIERVGVLYSPNNVASAATYKAQAGEMAPRLGLTAVPMPVQQPTEIDAALALIESERVQAIDVHPTPVIFAQRAKIAAFAMQRRVPTVGSLPVFARDGFLMSYGYDNAATWKRAANYLDRVFKGADPAETAIEQVDRFQLIINLKTAKALGLTVPSTVLARADEIIE